MILKVKLHRSKRAYNLIKKRNIRKFLLKYNEKEKFLDQTLKNCAL